MLNLIGGGGHASVIADIAQRAGIASIILRADDDPDLTRFPPGLFAWRVLR